MEEEKEVMNALIRELYYAFSGLDDGKIVLLSEDKLKRAYAIASQLYEYDMVDQDEVEAFVNDVTFEF